jgi:hypothetical protein
MTCARQVYVMPGPGLNGAAIGGDAIAELCIRKPRGSVQPAERTTFLQPSSVQKMSAIKA